LRSESAGTEVTLKASRMAAVVLVSTRVTRSLRSAPAGAKVTLKVSRMTAVVLVSIPCHKIT
jgi:hypothetical protein